MDTQLLLLAVMAATVPDVVVGPGLESEARSVAMPVAQATVFSDRAEVERRGALKLPAGIHVLALPDLPGATSEDTLRLTAQGAKVLRVEAAAVQRHRLAIDGVEAKVDAIEALDLRIAKLRAEASVWDHELQMLAQLGPAAAVPEHERDPKQRTPELAAALKVGLGWLGPRRTAARVAREKLRVQLRSLREERDRLQRELQQMDVGAFSERRLRVTAVVELRKARRVKFALSYFIPGAFWRPAYDLHFDPTAGEVVLQSGGRVTQATGEDWAGIELLLSTAMPGRGIALPKLLTWTLGQKREWMPRPRAARRPAAAPRYPPPVARSSAEEAEDIARWWQRQMQRIEQSRQLYDAGWEAALAEAPAGSLDALTQGLGDISGGAGSYGLGRGMGGGRGAGQLGNLGARSRKRASVRAKPAPPPRAPSAMMPGDHVTMGETSLEAEVQSDSSFSFGGLFTSGSDLSPSYRSMQLLDRGGPQRARLNDRTLPAMLAGGLDYVYRAVGSVDVPADAVDVEVPLGGERMPVETFYECTPSLMTTAYLKAVVRNGGRQPILAGPANIFVEGQFSGQGALRTTDPGGTLELPLGADDDIRIAYSVVPDTMTEGVFSKSEVTTYETRIEIGNYKKSKIRIMAFDQIPVSRSEEVEVKLLKRPRALAEGPDEKGILRFELQIPAGKTQTVKFRYRVQRPENFKLQQQN